VFLIDIFQVFRENIVSNSGLTDEKQNESICYQSKINLTSLIAEEDNSCAIVSVGLLVLITD